MRPLFPSAALAAILAMSAAHADVVIIRQGQLSGPPPVMQVMPQGSAFAMAEAFIMGNVVSRMPADYNGVVIAQPIPVEEPAADEPISFAGAWRLTEIMDDTGAPLDIDPDLLAVTEFNVDINGPFNAYVGCNRMFGELGMSDGMVTSAEYAMTMMACIGPVGELEQAFTHVLDSASLVAQGHDMLILLDGEGDKLAEFALIFEAP